MRSGQARLPWQIRRRRREQVLRQAVRAQREARDRDAPKRLQEWRATRQGELEELAERSKKMDAKRVA